MDTDLTRDEEYWSKIEKLNRSFLGWIQKYMGISPDYDFSPVCADYINHVNSLQQTYPMFEKKVTVTTNATSTAPTNPPSAIPIVNFGHSSASTSHPSTPHPKMISKTVITTVSEPPKTVTDEVMVDGSNGPESNAIKTEPSEKSNNDGGDVEPVDEDAPPPPPPPRVFEEEALYSIRCKLYALVADSYKERGVGQLYVKKNEGKSQLIIRTDNAIGTIMLNIRLTKMLPISATSKGVLLGCTPNPPMEDLKTDGPVTLLIRVKNNELALQLKEKLLEHRD